MKDVKDIFVSYRRSDVPEHTGRICDYLMFEFGEGRIFKDVDSLPPGDDWRPAIVKAVGGCKVLLAIIGPGWLDATENGQRRLDNDKDFVRNEIAAALERKVPVIPVLVAGASRPTADQLPKPLRRLAYRQAVVLPDDPLFRPAMKRLHEQLRKHVRPWSVLWRSRWQVLFWGICLGLLAGVGGAAGYYESRPVPNDEARLAAKAEETPDAAEEKKTPDNPDGAKVEGRINHDGVEAEGAINDGVEVAATINGDPAEVKGEIRTPSKGATITGSEILCEGTVTGWAKGLHLWLAVDGGEGLKLTKVEDPRPDDSEAGVYRWSHRLVVSPGDETVNIWLHAADDEAHEWLESNAGDVSGPDVEKRLYLLAGIRVFREGRP